MSDLRGKVVLIDFWTYTCINCIRTLPYLEAWQQRYGRDGFTVVGVHSPEFPFEKDASNVQAAIRQNHLTYPVVQDNDLGTWDAWGNQYWPADYLVDAQGNVRDAHFGEGDYSETERAIRTLLAEAGHTNLGSGARATAQAPSAGDTHPGDLSGSRSRTGMGHAGPPRRPGLRGTARLALRQSVRLCGPLGNQRRGRDLRRRSRDRHGVQRASCLPGARLSGAARHIQVLLDGKPIPAKLAGADVRRGAATIRAQRLYRLVDLPAVSQHRLTLRFDPGISGYAFTFG